MLKNGQKRASLRTILSDTKDFGEDIIGGLNSKESNARQVLLIIARRGDASFARENTIEAFERAINIGADMIEFDILKTKRQKGKRYVIIIVDLIFEGVFNYASQYLSRKCSKIQRKICCH